MAESLGIVLGLVILVLVVILIFIESERRSAANDKQNAELRQYIMEGEVRRLEEEKNALTQTLAQNRSRLNDLLKERTELVGGAAGSDPKSGNGKS